jgi:ribonuclease P protein component
MAATHHERDRCAQTDLPTQADSAQARARFSQADEHTVGPGGAQGPARQGPQAADGRLRRPATFGPERRLRARARFQELQRRGRFFGNDLIAVRVLPSTPDVPTRFGFAVGKRIGKAVRRNRLRRRLREIVRQAPVRPGRDILVLARPAAASVSYATLRAAVLEVLARAHALESPAP